MVTLDDHQRDTYRRGMARAGSSPRQLRVVLCFLTETNGRQLRNDGRAFHPDPAQRRPGWADGWPAARCQPVYDALRRSLAYPDHGTGSNGGSTGAAQGLSDDYLTALYGRPVSYGWGSIAQQLDPDTGVEFIADRFLAKLQVTDDPVYRYTDDAGRPRAITCADPALADVLRVQQPRPSEAESDNYGVDEVALATQIVAELAAATEDWIIDMADQAALAAYARDIAKAVWEYNVTSRVTGQPVQIGDMLTYVNQDLRTIADAIKDSGISKEILQAQVISKVTGKPVQVQDLLGYINAALDDINSRIPRPEKKETSA